MGARKLAGSGKSYLGCYWVFISCLQYPGIRCLIGRARLNNLKRTTLKTLLDIFKLNNYTDFHINNTTSTITFPNGSEIILMDLYPYPQDIDFDRLGSLEITLGFIDELSEVSWKGFQVLSSRIRYKLNEYKLIPKLFCASNPTNNWAKNYFYTPFIEGREKENVRFVQALSSDNPFLPSTYLETMKNTLDFSLRQRLLFGDWSFESDDYNLFDYDKLQQCFYNESLITTGKYYISADIADLGNDKTVICVWDDWRVVKIVKLEQKETTQVVEKINQLRVEYKIPIGHIVIDSVGVGSGVASLLKGVVRYMGSNKSINGGYRNIKTECFYKFAERVNNLEVSFSFPYSDELIQECILYKKEFSGLIAGVTSKDKIKQSLGRSPDLADALYLRAYFDLKIGGTIKIRVI